MLTEPFAERDKPLVEAERLSRKALERRAGQLKCIPREAGRGIVGREVSSVTAR